MPAITPQVLLGRLAEIGAGHIVSSPSPTYKEDLIAACKATGATLAFDATGGGTLAAEIITAMEAALKLNGTAAHPAYGTATHKQVYRYGGLQKGPTELPYATQIPSKRDRLRISQDAKPRGLGSG